MTRPWVTASTDVKHETWRKALVETSGNISAAATAIGISRAQATRLVKQFNLGEFAAQLRLARGGTRVRVGYLKGRVLGRLPGDRKK